MTKLFEENECLVVETSDNQLLIADSYCKQTYALYGYKFSHVTVDEYTFLRTFEMKDVLFFRLNNEDVRQLINGLHESYGKLAEYAQKAYQKSRGQKGIMSISSKASGAPDFEKKLEQMMNERFKTYFGADNAVLPLTDGFEYKEQDRKTYNADSTRDIRAQVDDIFVFTARAFGIPPALILGELSDTSKAIDSMLTFCIDPVCDMIQEEINRKRNGQKNFLAGTFLKIDTKSIKHIDLLAVSTSIDKLISSGAFCINDIRWLVGDEPIDEPWARQHWMTKNYSTVSDIMDAMNGGGVSENVQNNENIKAVET
jgi:HK97 family phage portal protein